MINQHMGLNYHLWLTFRPQTLKILHPESLFILTFCFKVGCDHCSCLSRLFQQHPCQPFISNLFCCILSSAGTVILPKAQVSSNCIELRFSMPWPLDNFSIVSDMSFPYMQSKLQPFQKYFSFSFSTPWNSFHLLAFGLGAFYPRLLFKPFIEHLNVNLFLESIGCSLNGIRCFPLSLCSTLYLFLAHYTLQYTNFCNGFLIFLLGYMFLQSRTCGLVTLTVFCQVFLCEAMLSLL